MDGLTQSQNPGLNTKSKPWTTRGLVPNSSDLKSSLSCSSSMREKNAYTKKKLSRGKGDKNCRGDVGDWENVIM